MLTACALASSDRTVLPTTLALRIGAYELLHLRTPDHAAVSEAVSLVQPQAQRKFVNGVLRNLARQRDTLRAPSEDPTLQPLAALAIETSTPEWLLRNLSSAGLPELPMYLSDEPHGADPVACAQ